jgi:hypothetical protein
VAGDTGGAAMEVVKNQTSVREQAAKLSVFHSINSYRALTYQMLTIDAWYDSMGVSYLLECIKNCRSEVMWKRLRIVIFLTNGDTSYKEKTKCEREYEGLDV